MIASPKSATVSGLSNIADTIVVELHSSVTPFNTIYTSKSVINTEGNGNFQFPISIIGYSYYVVVKHRNSIETWSANPVQFNSNYTSYDFTNNATKALGNNLVNDGNGRFMIYTGDINQDGSVDFNDYPSLDISSNNGDLGYFVTDLNGDASVDFNDYPTLDVNSSLGVLTVKP